MSIRKTIYDLGNAKITNEEYEMNNERFRRYLDQFGNTEDNPIKDDARCMVKYFCYENNDFVHMSNDRLRRVALWVECLHDYKPNLYEFYSHNYIGSMHMTIEDFKEAIMFEICARAYDSIKKGVDISNYFEVLLSSKPFAVQTYNYFIENGGF